MDIVPLPVLPDCTAEATPDWVRTVCYLHTLDEVREAAYHFGISHYTVSGTGRSRSTLTTLIIREMFPGVRV